MYFYLNMNVNQTTQTKQFPLQIWTEVAAFRVMFLAQ